MITCRIVADIKVLLVFTCIKCSARRVGGTIRFDVDVADSNQLKEAIDINPATDHYIPIGWSSNTDGVSCERCV